MSASEPPPGRFVVLEGADGSGKTAIADILCGDLRSRGGTVVRVSRANPSGRREYASIVAAVAQLFRASDDAGTPLHLLALGAAMQHATMFESQARPAIDGGAYVVADSWWAKTHTRFAVEARRCTDWREPDHQQFAEWMANLLPRIYESSMPGVVTVLIDTPKADRITWYGALRARQVIYDRRGACSQDPAEFGDFTEEIQAQLRVLATRSRWARVENHAGKDLLSVAKEVLAIVGDT